MRGPAGYGRYDYDPQHVGCPYAKSDMTPCIARDGHTALAGDPPTDCVGCANTPAYLLGDLAAEYPPAGRLLVTSLDTGALADHLRDVVRAVTEPGGRP